MNAPSLLLKRSAHRTGMSVVLLVVLALYGGWTYLSLSPREFIGNETARVILVRDIQTKGRTVDRFATIQLASGQVVGARIPRGVYLQNGDPVRVSVYERTWPPRSRFYALAIEID